MTCAHWELCVMGRLGLSVFPLTLHRQGWPDPGGGVPNVDSDLVKKWPELVKKWPELVKKNGLSWSKKV